VDEEIELDNDHIISWDDFQKNDQRKTFGLLSQVSPDGRYVVSTVKDLSVFRPVDNLTFSQLFFPVKGILCIYDRETESFAALPGADDEQYVQSNAVWSPDGKYIVFARAKALEVPEPRVNELGLTEADEMPDFVKTKQPFRFDLYRIPFNDGRGGLAEPLAGASHNGRSNYFARYSPDGRWIVFCQANSYMLLQPDSELYIIPAGGGDARRLECNRELMNSWHSWSPNSRWLVFTSKVFTPYTQLFLAHIDEQGKASPPVLLSWFSAPDMAANIPEFVNTRPDAIHLIRDAFAEDLHHVRKGDQYAMQGRADLALECFQKALEINPQCAEAYRLWGVLLMSQQKLSEAEQHIRKSIELADHSNYAYWNLAKLMAIQNRNTEALAMFRKAIELNPNYAPIRQDFGSLLLRLGRADEARAQLMTARQVAH
jgi:tetratricopeptide (TPR) repeat protein